MLKIIHKIIGYVFAFVILVAILLSGVYLVKKAINKDQPTYMFGYAFYRVDGASMDPTIPVGSLIVVEKLDEYQVNMIVTYKFPNDNKPTTHRIIGIDSKTNYFITKGDNEVNDTDPEPLNPEYIIGAHVLTWESYSDITSTKGIIIIGITGFILIDIYFVIEKKIDKGKKDKEKESN